MKAYAFRLAATCALLASTPVYGVQLIAHRGASYDAPENTLASFKLGYAQKADADELDVYLTQDGRIVVTHDGSTLRTAGVSNYVAATRFEDLRKLNVGNWGKFAGQGFNEKIPLLEEVLPLIPDGKRLFIEIKCGPEVLPELARVLARSGKKPEQTVIIGFGHETVKQAKAKFPHLEVCWLAGARKDKTYAPVDELIQQAKAAGVDGLDLEQGFPIDAAFVAKVRRAGLKLYTWTVDDPVVARKQAAAGVDGITTNRPEWLREQLQAAP